MYNQQAEEKMLIEFQSNLFLDYIYQNVLLELTQQELNSTQSFCENQPQTNSNKVFFQATKNFKSLEEDIQQEKSAHTIATKTTKIKRGLLEQKSSQDMGSDNTIQCIKQGSQIESSKIQNLYAKTKANTLEEKIQNKTEEEKQEEAQILGDALDNPNFQNARTQQNFDIWNLDKYSKSSQIINDDDESLQTPKMRHYKYIQQQSSYLTENTPVEKSENIINLKPEKLARGKKNQNQKIEGFSQLVELVEEQLSQSSDNENSIKEKSPKLKKKSLKLKKQFKKQQKQEIQQISQQPNYPLYPCQNPHQFQSQQYPPNYLPQQQPYAYQYPMHQNYYQQPPYQPIPYQMMNQYQGYPHHQQPYLPYQQNFQQQYNYNQQIPYCNLEQVQQQNYQAEIQQRKKQKKKQKKAQKQQKNFSREFQQTEEIIQQEELIVPMSAEDIEQRLQVQSKLIEQQLQKFDRQKKKLQQGNKKHKDKVVVFLHQDQVLIVLFSTSQFQINGILGFFKKSQFYKVAKKNDSETQKEEVYFQCEFEFFNRQYRNKYWSIQDKIYKKKVERQKIICQFIRRGEYILKANINGKIFYRDDKTNFMNYLNFFKNPAFTQEQFVFQIGLYTLKVLFKQQKFVVELAGTNNNYTQYTGMVSKLKNVNETVPQILFKKHGQRYKAKCLYKKFLQNNSLYHVSHIELFYFVYNQTTQKLFFYSSFVQGDADFIKMSNQLRQFYFENRRGENVKVEKFEDLEKQDEAYEDFLKFLDILQKAKKELDQRKQISNSYKKLDYKKLFFGIYAITPKTPEEIELMQFCYQKTQKNMLKYSAIGLLSIDIYYLKAKFFLVLVDQKVSGVALGAIYGILQSNKITTQLFVNLGKEYEISQMIRDDLKITD